MWPYWLLFGVTALMALINMQTKDQIVKIQRPAWLFFLSLLAFSIGLRHEVGADWFNYQGHLDSATGISLENVLGPKKDPAYALLNWFGGNVWGDIYFVNLICGLLFSWGLVAFCRLQPRSWLALVVAVPYLVTVVAMGYSRQGVAIGVAMLGLSALMRGSVFRFVFWIAVAATFHKSAVILVPLALFSRSHYRLLTLAGVLVATALLFVLILQESIDSLVSGYIVAEYESSGAAIRIAMNALPAALFLFYRKKFDLSQSEKNFWTWVSIGGVLFVPLLLASPSSTAVDRLALYWIPLQLFVWSRLPDAMGRSAVGVRRWVCGVVAYCFAVHFVWLIFSAHSIYWIPYRFYPWEWLWS